MPASSKLKVFRTPIGFHDAYVAAPSQKAAIEAWGVDKGIFARGEAEEVTDPELVEEPLASPGKVIKRLRGSTAEQIAALGPEPSAPSPNTKAASKPKSPRPSRDRVDEAEQALTEAKARHKDALRQLAEREAALAQERRTLERAQAQETERLNRAREKAESAYEAALKRWRG